MRDSVFDWVKNLQRLIIGQARGAREINLRVRQVEEIKETSTGVVQMTTNEFNNLQQTAKMLQRLMSGWKISVYSMGEHECIIYATRKS